MPAATLLLVNLMMAFRLWLDCWETSWEGRRFPAILSNRQDHESAQRAGSAQDQEEHGRAEAVDGPADERSRHCRDHVRPEVHDADRGPGALTTHQVGTERP